MRILNLNLLLVGLLLCSGCTAMKSRLSKDSVIPTSTKKSSSQDEAAAEQNPLPDFETPQKMLAIWKDSVHVEDNGLAMRGLGGRLYLYNKNGAAVRAKGDLIVYGFDDSVTNRQGSKADRKIVIPNEQLQQHYSESALGPSYSVWISWDRVGSVDKNVTLVPFFRTPVGDIVQAGQAIYALHTPGQKTDSLHKERISSFQQTPRSNVANRVSQVNYVESAGNQGTNTQLQAGQSRNTNVRTTTISLPRATQQRLQTSDFVGDRRSSTQGQHQTQPISTSADSPSESKPSRLEEARLKRKQQIKEGNVFGMPGQL